MEAAYQYDDGTAGDALPIVCAGCHSWRLNPATAVTPSPAQCQRLETQRGASFADPWFHRACLAGLLAHKPDPSAPMLDRQYLPTDDLAALRRALWDGTPIRTWWWRGNEGQTVVFQRLAGTDVVAAWTAPLRLDPYAVRPGYLLAEALATLDLD